MDREAMKHTPGPWVVDPAVRQGFTVYAPKEGFIVGPQDEEGRYGAIESEANARLIAAAPDLLSALDDLARYADTCELFLRETHPGKADMLRKRVTAAIDAIAKATGGEV